MKIAFLKTTAVTLASVLLATGAALADQADDTLRVAFTKELENVDSYFNSSREGLGSSFKCNTQSPLGIGCCDGHTKQAPQQRGPWRDISRA
jgi:hypothetical protein